MDLNYAKDIMSAMVDDPEGFPPPHICPPIVWDNWDFDWLNDPQVQKFYQHCKQLSEAGFVLLSDDRSSFAQPVGLTYAGYLLLDEWRHPFRYWLKRNWFPALVAFATIAVSASGILFNACA